MADNDGNMAMLMSMGFDRDQSVQALNDSGESVERAIDSLLSGGGSGGGATSQQDVASSSAQNNNDIRAVHSDISQYSDSLGKSACTSIALTMACNLFQMTNLEGVINSEFLSNSVQEGIRLYSAFRGSSANGMEHSSVEELLTAFSASADNNSNPTARKISASLKQFNFSPRQGILSNSTDNPMCLETVLSQCQSDAMDPQSYIAIVITKPPETILVLLPPRSQSQAMYILLDSHPRPQQLLPHCPTGSYALFHPTLSSLVSSIKQIFPVTELGNDVPEMMAMMYNSFDAYPFQHQGRGSF